MARLIAFRITLLWAAVLLVAGCTGMTPYDPPEYGEMKPGRGLISGADGEFVIYQKPEEADPDTNKSTGQKQP
jgi:hypothetical protein